MVLAAQTAVARVTANAKVLAAGARGAVMVAGEGEEPGCGRRIWVAILGRSWGRVACPAQHVPAAIETGQHRRNPRGDLHAKSLSLDRGRQQQVPLARNARFLRVVEAIAMRGIDAD